MKNLLNRLQPVDFIAIVTLICGTFLKAVGIDGTVGMMLTAIVLFYFGEKKITEKKKEKKLPEAKRETVEQIIIRIAKEMGASPDLATRVAKCESGLDPSAVNVNTDKSKDRGVFQWNNKWHPEITDQCAFDVECATRAFCKAFNEGHLSWWNASKKCWA